MNFWEKGKSEQRRFYNVKLGSKDSIISSLFSLLITGIVFLPLGLVLFQFIFIYGYNRTILYIYLIFVWIGVLGFNALMNYLAVRFAKAMDKNNNELQSIDEKYIFYYQLFNPAFAFVALAFILFIAFLLTGGFR